MAARRKRPTAAEVPVPALVQEVHEILDRIGAGERPDPGQLQLVAASMAGLRRDWLREIAEAIGFLHPGMPEFVAFKNCLQSIGTLFVQHGVVSAGEMQHIWVTVELAEQGVPLPTPWRPS